jgi:hypothetical protein
MFSAGNRGSNSPGDSRDLRHYHGLNCLNGSNIYLPARMAMSYLGDRTALLAFSSALAATVLIIMPRSGTWVTIRRGSVVEVNLDRTASSHGFAVVWYKLW